MEKANGRMTAPVVVGMFWSAQHEGNPRHTSERRHP
jgi:hypothetical protein